MSRRREHPGWHAVWALSVTVTVGHGVLSHAHAVFVVPVREELDASTAQVSGALTLALAVHGLAAVPVGRWLDRHGARGVGRRTSRLVLAAPLGACAVLHAVLPRRSPADLGLAVDGATAALETAAA